MVLKVWKRRVIIANCLNLPHNEKEMVREDPFSQKFNTMKKKR